MANRVLRFLTIMTLFGAVLSISVWSAARFDGNGKRQVQDANKPIENSRRKTLRDIAQGRDIDTTYESESDTEFGDLESLTKYAGNIVLGRITNAESSFDKSNEHIETFYTVEVSRVLKADSPLTSPLRLFRPGGTVHINGHTASVKVKGNDALIVGQDYLFFLGWVPRHQVYVLEGGLGAAFLVKDNSKIKPLSTQERSRLKLKYDGADLETFISDVLKLQ